MRHEVPERRDDQSRVLSEPTGGVPDRPAALLLQRGRQVPVVKGDERLDAAYPQAGEQTSIEGDRLRVQLAVPGGLEP